MLHAAPGAQAADAADNAQTQAQMLAKDEIERAAKDAQDEAAKRELVLVRALAHVAPPTDAPAPKHTRGCSVQSRVPIRMECRAL